MLLLVHLCLAFGLVGVNIAQQTVVSFAGPGGAMCLTPGGLLGSCVYTSGCFIGGATGAGCYVGEVCCLRVTASGSYPAVHTTTPTITTTITPTRTTGRQLCTYVRPLPTSVSVFARSGRSRRQVRRGVFPGQARRSRTQSFNVGALGSNFRRRTLSSSNNRRQSLNLNSGGRFPGTNRGFPIRNGNSFIRTGANRGRFPGTRIGPGFLDRLQNSLRDFRRPGFGPGFPGQGPNIDAGPSTPTFGDGGPHFFIAGDQTDEQQGQGTGVISVGPPRPRPPNPSLDDLLGQLNGGRPRNPPFRPQPPRTPPQTSDEFTVSVLSPSRPQPLTFGGTASGPGNPNRTQDRMQYETYIDFCI